MAGSSLKIWNRTGPQNSQPWVSCWFPGQTKLQETSNGVEWGKMVPLRPVYGGQNGLVVVEGNLQTKEEHMRNWRSGGRGLCGLSVALT